MNVFTLKIIALISMMIDHYGAIFHDNIDIYRIIGRIAFPIYCFLLVEGYLHTKDVKKYAIRLLIFALISEIPFDLAFYGMLSFYHQNVFFTLFIGLVTIHLLDNPNKYKYRKGLIYLFATILSIIAGVDYSFMGLIYILAFYYTKDFNKTKRFIIIALILFLTNLLSHPIQQFSLLALPILYIYNGELGPKNKVLQILFYAAYPIHLIIYYFLNTSLI
ncbi:MAG: TraX family protein [Tissierellia bacterium]|nr:TraX family protein [Tissierellia bacterium]MDD4725981.1 TraX family protein [Tissierellia bacterium]